MLRTRTSSYPQLPDENSVENITQWISNGSKKGVLKEVNLGKIVKDTDRG